MRVYKKNFWTLDEHKAEISRITRQAREENKTTLDKFAEPLKVSHTAVANWESGRAIPDMFTYLYATKAGGFYTMWAVKCLSVLGFLPALVSLAQAASQYQDSTGAEGCHERD